MRQVSGSFRNQCGPVFKTAVAGAPESHMNYCILWLIGKSATISCRLKSALQHRLVAAMILNPSHNHTTRYFMQASEGSPKALTGLAFKAI